MSVRKPTLIRSAFLYVIVGFLPVAANFLLAPVYTKFLLPDQYALVGLATLFQIFLTFFLSLSLDSAFSRIYFQYERKYKLKYALLSSLLLTVTIISICVLALLFFCGDWIFSLVFTNQAFRFTNFGYWVVLITFSNIIFLFFAILYRNEENTRKFILINLLFFFIPVIGTLTGLIFYENGALGAVIGRAIGSLMFIAVLLLFFFRRYTPTFKLRYLRIALRFSLPIIPYQLMFAGFSNIDRFILERYFTPHDFGVYNFAVMITGVIPVFLNALGNATNPRIFRLLAGGKDLETVKRINYFSLFLSTAVICLCIAGVVPVMRIVINEEYADSYIYIGTLFMSFIFYLHYLIFNVPLFFFSKTKVFPIIALCALVAGILFNIAFIEHLGIWAVCLSLYIIRMVQAVVAWFYVHYYKFKSLSYVRHPNAIFTSLIIIVVYNIFLLWHYKFNILSIDLVNISPLAVFLLLSPFLYREEVFLIWKKLFSKEPKAAA